jgi:hypothetical protein
MFGGHLEVLLRIDAPVVAHLLDDADPDRQRDLGALRALSDRIVFWSLPTHTPTV